MKAQRFIVGIKTPLIPPLDLNTLFRQTGSFSLNKGIKMETWTYGNIKSIGEFITQNFNKNTLIGEPEGITDFCFTEGKDLSNYLRWSVRSWGNKWTIHFWVLNGNKGDADSDKIPLNWTFSH